MRLMYNGDEVKPSGLSPKKQRLTLNEFVALCRSFEPTDFEKQCQMIASVGEQTASIPMKQAGQF